MLRRQRREGVYAETREPWKVVREHRQCQFCYHRYCVTHQPEPEPEPEPVTAAGDPEDEDPTTYGTIYVPVLCPHCGSRDHRTTSTRVPTRYHKCRSCGRRFKSTEA